MAAQKEFWLKEFSSEVPELTLPLDYSRSLTSNNEGGIVWFNLDHERTTALKALASEEHTTLFVVLLSIYNVLLSKLANVEDVVVGTSVSGRAHADLEQLAGIFINSLALRNLPTGNKVFREFLKEANKRTFAAFEHQEYPYEDLIEALNLKRDNNRHPLFSVMFEYFNFEHPELTLPGLTLEPYSYDPPVSRFDLTLRVNEENGQLIMSFQYAGDLFKRSSVESFATAFQKLTESILAKPEAADQGLFHSLLCGSEFTIHL